MKASRAILVSSAMLAGIGCNAILANEPGVLVITDEAGTEPAPPAQGEDSGTSTSQPPLVTTPDAGDACPPGQRSCGGVCVSAADPLHGCGSPSCAPCVTPHAAAACQGGTCVVASCSKGYADCNAQPADGCEVDLSKAPTCGACNASCGPVAPFCAPIGGTFECTTGCTAAAPLLCGEECVDPTSNVMHCGACNRACPAVKDATIACEASVCTFTCTGARRACNGTCVDRTEPTACGPTCAVCPVPANARATCTNDACGFTCKEQFADCNKLPIDGCEADLSDDAANCGQCGNVCPAGSTCKHRHCRTPGGPGPG